jgi:hypothetical protein
VKLHKNLIINWELKKGVIFIRIFFSLFSSSMIRFFCNLITVAGIP